MLKSNLFFIFTLLLTCLSTCLLTCLSICWTSALAEESATPPPANWSEKTEELFQQKVQEAFKKNSSPLPSANEVLMPFYYGNSSQPMGDLMTLVEAQQLLKLNKQTLFYYLQKIVATSWWNQKEVLQIFPHQPNQPKDFKKNQPAFDQQNPWVSIHLFENTGITLSYDEALLRVNLDVPPELRQAKVSSLTKLSHLPSDEELENPSRFSSYLNINIIDSYDSSHLNDRDGRAPLHGLFESGTNVGGVVLEAYGNYVEDRGQIPSTERSWTREDARLVKDFPESTLRTQLGDLIYPLRTFQVYKPMAGLALTRQFNLQPSNLTYPSGNYELFLKRPSKVYVWVNEQLHQILDLPAGRHQLKEFPFTNGINDLRMEIIDDLGRQETVQHSYFSNTELLKNSLHQFSYALGAPMTPYHGDRNYDDKNLIFSGFHRLGVSENLTLGANLQAQRTQSVLGFESVHSTPIGYFKFEPAFNSSKGVDLGWTLSSRYLYMDYKGAEKTQRSFNFGITYFSDTFTTLDTPFSEVHKYFDVASSYTTGLSHLLSLNFGLNYGVNKKNLDGMGNSFSLSAGLNRRWDNGINTSLSARHTRAANGVDDFTLLAFLLWSFPKERQVLTVSHNTSDNSSRADWSYNPSSGAGAPIVQAGLKDEPKQKGYNGQLQYNGNRVRVIASHEVTIQKDTDSSLTTTDSPQHNARNWSSLQLSTALVFAGGRLALSRPVTDSFAIVANTKNLKNQKLRLNPQSDETYAAATDFMGAAVLPELASYNFSVVNVGAQDLPQGTSLPRDHFNLYPTYKSGYLFTLGTDAVVYLTAQIQLPNGEFLATTAGRAFYLDDPSEPPVTVFTNRQGLLRSEGFRPGRYRLELSSDQYEPAEFMIPQDVNQEYNLGTLQLKTKVR